MSATDCNPKNDYKDTEPAYAAREVTSMHDVHDRVCCENDVLRDELVQARNATAAARNATAAADTATAHALAAATTNHGHQSVVSSLPDSLDGYRGMSAADMQSCLSLTAAVLAKQSGTHQKPAPKPSVYKSSPPWNSLIPDAVNLVSYRQSPVAMLTRTRLSAQRSARERDGVCIRVLLRLGRNPATRSTNDGVGVQSLRRGVRLLME